jgi:hypothetical protein
LRCAIDDCVAATGGKLAAPFWGFWGKRNPFQATSRALLEFPRIFASSAYATKKLGTHPSVQSERGHLSIPFGDWNGFFFARLRWRMHRAFFVLANNDDNVQQSYDVG